ncbi:olfactory receptor 52D1-like [Polypterus senegalus]|uniref:olfactory receptor 52D1-like n=1 Tax=Polypterus senegalus TaxID=55291 RepID=UPI001963027A|nr:olfactory receptor 52D1-like [Polypterus senegalus]
MEVESHKNHSYSTFFLIVFPSFYDYRRIIFIPVFILFILAILLNSGIIFVITTGSGLHLPMYILICTMAVVDLTIPMTFTPKMLLSLLLDWNDISLVGCLVQMFFVHFVSSFESTILLVMAIDRYVAICNPLRYNDYINISNFLKIAVFALFRSIIFVFLIILFASSLTFCLSNVIEHCYCEHMVVVGLACENTNKNNIMGLVAAFSIAGLDLLFILFSYGKIFFAVLRSASGKSKQKAISTCGTHLIVILMTYCMGLSSFLAYRFRNSVTSDFHNLISVSYLLLPSCFNPIIYGVRTKEIREQILRKLGIGKTLPVSNRGQSSNI